MIFIIFNFHFDSRKMLKMKTSSDEMLKYKSFKMTIQLNGESEFS